MKTKEKKIQDQRVQNLEFLKNIQRKTNKKRGENNLW